MLDSNVVSELRSAKRCDPKVRAWQAGVATQACYISVVVLLELRKGIEHVKAKDVVFAAALEEWFTRTVKPGFANRSLIVSPAIAERAGAISALRTRGMADCVIAATALEHYLTLVTRNVADFDDINGLNVVNPWES